MKNIPNIFTLLNLCMGCIAIVLILQTNESIINLQGNEWKIYFPESIAWASAFILLAAIVDFFDGFVARLFKSTSEMGKQLDSLADQVSFGVAPGLILFQMIRISLASEPAGLEASVLWFLPSFFIPMAAAWRLARFNLDTTHKQHFEGVPTPAAGLLIASFPLLMHYNPYNIQLMLTNKWVLYFICLAIPWLMVSKLPLMNLKFKQLSFRENKARYVLILISILLIPFLGWLSVIGIFITYILLSLAFKNQLT